MNISINGEAKIPLYEQVYSAIKKQITAGTFKEGFKLPSKRDLCSRLGISMSTVETAYGMLLAEGYIYSKVKSGYYVSTALEHSHTETARKKKSVKEKDSDRPEYDLSISGIDTSVFPYATWAKLTKEIVYNNPELLQRGDKKGEYGLRQAISDYLYENRGVDASAENIILGAGMEYLFDMIFKIAKTDCGIAVETPGYPLLWKIAENIGVKLFPVTLDKNGFEIHSLSKKNIDSSLIYVTPNHQFPTGITMPVGRRLELLDWASGSADRYIIEDDYDSEFRYSTRPIPALKSLDKADKVIYIGTFSRTIAPSFRIAYMVLPDKLIDSYEIKYRLSSSTVSRYEQETLRLFIERRYYERHLRRVGLVYKNRYSAFCRELSAFDNLEIKGGGAGLHFLLNSKTLKEKQLVSLAATQKINLKGLGSYSYSEKESSSVVIGYGGIKDSEIGPVVHRLCECWKL